MDFSVSQSVKDCLCDLSRAMKCQNTVRYLGIKITLKLEDLIKVNLTPLLKDVQKQLESWNKLPLPWFGPIAVIKMKVLPRFLFF